MRATSVVLAIVATVSVCSSLSLDSTDRVGVVGSIGASRYDATFGSLPGIPSCCSWYGSRWNLSWGVGVLVERAVGTIAGLPATGELRLGFQNLSGRLQRDEFIANVIVDDQVHPGISRYQLDATLWALSLEPVLRIPLPWYRDIGFDIGARLDWIARAHYQQREQLISPSVGAVFETGTTVRNESSGEIPTHAGWGASINLGVSYSLPLDSVWTLRPELRGQFALTSIADVPWRVHRILAGVSVVRSLPMPATAPPPPPPPPPPLVLHVESRLRGAHHQYGDTATVELGARQIVRRTMLMPVVFFAPASATLDSVARAHLQRLAQVARQRHRVIHVAPSIAPGENDSLRRERFEAVRSFLEREGVAVATLPAVAPMPRNTAATAIADELRAAWISASEPLIEEAATTVTTTEPSLAIVLRAHAPSPIGGLRLDATIEQDATTRTLPLRNGADEVIELSPSPLLEGMRTQYRVLVVARGDDRQQPVEHHIRGVVVPQYVVADTILESNRNGLLLLGRCNFDAATLSDVDSVVVESVRRAIARGERVTLIGSTDSLGSDTYNRLLARRRVEAALAVLRVPPAAVQIEERIGGSEDNGTLYGRIANRGVFVRIERR